MYTPEPLPSRSLVPEKKVEAIAKTNGDAGSKRKADGAAKEDGHVEKRAKRTPEDMDVDPVPATVACTLA